MIIFRHRPQKALNFRFILILILARSAFGRIYLLNPLPSCDARLAVYRDFCLDSDWMVRSVVHREEEGHGAKMDEFMDEMNGGIKNAIGYLRAYPEHSSEAVNGE